MVKKSKENIPDCPSEMAPLRVEEKRFSIHHFSIVIFHLNRTATNRIC